MSFRGARASSVPFSYSRLYAAALVCLVSFIVACSGREAERGARRVAIVPFENLTSDPSLDWLGVALAGIIAGETIGSSEVLPLQVASSRDAWSRRATDIIHGYFTRRGELLEISAVVMDQQSRKSVQKLHAVGSAGSIVSLADSVAKQLSGDAHAYGTRNERAIEHYFRASQSNQPAEQRQLLQSAIQADPAFGLAHIALIQSYVSTGERENAVAALQAASSNTEKFQPVARERLELVRASLAGDRARQTSALRNIAKLAKNDADVWRNLGQLELLNKNCAQAVSALEAAIDLEPDNIPLWNQLGYARAYAGDLGGAVKALERYRELAPDDANALDSLGDVHFYSGRFAEAEKYYLEAHQKNSALLGGGDLYRAAFARLVTGDVDAADQQFDAYIKFRQSLGDGLLPVRRANWWWMSGRRSRANKELAELANSGSTPADLAGLASAQLAIWALSERNLADARSHAQQASSRAQSAGVRALAAMTAAVASGSADPRLPPNIAGHSLFFSGRIPEAAQLWRRIYTDASADNSTESRIMLAWALLETGNSDQARVLLQAWPLPGVTGEPGFGALLFPRYLELRSRVSTGEDAERLRSLYRRLSAN